MKKNYLIFLCALTAAALITGCGSKTDNVKVQEGNTAASEAAGSEAAQTEAAESEAAASEAEAETEAVSEAAEPDYVLAEEETILGDAGITASSVLPRTTENFYGVSNLTDGKLDTAWVEGESGDGVGSYVEYLIQEGTAVTGGTIWPAYFKSEKVFERNNAVTAIEISSGGVSMQVDCSDAVKTYTENSKGFEFTLPEALVSDGTVRITILSIRKGSKYQDTCISELYLRGREVVGGTMAGSGSEYVIPEDEVLEDICSAASNLCTYKNWNKIPEKGTVFKTAEVDSETRCFIAYWYQYFNGGHDPRITEEGWEHNKATRSDMQEILDSLVNGAVESDIETFVSRFADKTSGDTLYMYATGDFGDAGAYFLRYPYAAGIEDGRLKVICSIAQYNSSKGNYVEVRKAVIRLLPAENGIFDGWILDEIEL